jgi:hypothetical protein
MRDRKEDLKERYEQVDICLKAEPVQVIENEYSNISPVTHVANLSNTDMIKAYKGCGKCTAYVKDGYLVAFHYGYERPDNRPKDCEAIRVEASCTQLCFFDYPSVKFRLYEEKGKQIIERIVYPRFKAVVTMGILSDIEDIELLDDCTDYTVLARAMRAAGEFLIKGSRIR